MTPLLHELHTIDSSGNIAKLDFLQEAAERSWYLHRSARVHFDLELEVTELHSWHESNLWTPPRSADARVGLSWGRMDTI